MPRVSRSLLDEVYIFVEADVLHHVMVVSLLLLHQFDRQPLSNGVNYPSEIMLQVKHAVLHASVEIGSKSMAV